MERTQGYGSSKGDGGETLIEPKFLKMQKIRQQLPVTKFREKVLKTVASSQVTLISAQTEQERRRRYPNSCLRNRRV